MQIPFYLIFWCHKLFVFCLFVWNVLFGATITKVKLLVEKKEQKYSKIRSLSSYQHTQVKMIKSRCKVGILPHETHFFLLFYSRGHGGPPVRLQPAHQCGVLGQAPSGPPAGGRWSSGQRVQPERRDRSPGCLQGSERGTSRARDCETPQLPASEQGQSAVSQVF